MTRLEDGRGGNRRDHCAAGMGCIDADLTAGVVTGGRVPNEVANSCNLQDRQQQGRQQAPDPLSPGTGIRDLHVRQAKQSVILCQGAKLGELRSKGFLAAGHESCKPLAHDTPTSRYRESLPAARCSMH